MLHFKLFLHSLCLFLCFISASSANAKTVLKFVTQNFPPFHYLENGVVSGPAPEIVQAICNEMKIKCSIELLQWTQAQNEVKTGDANGMFVIGRNKKREKWLHFGTPIIKTEYGFFVHSSNALTFKNVSDIKGYKVGVYGPSNTATSLEKVKKEVSDIIIDMRKESVTALQLLSLTWMDAVYSNKLVANELIKKNKLENIRYAGKHRELDYYIGFSKEYNDKKIIEKFYTTLENLKKTDVIQNILKKYSM